ncbi:hypothetical protein TOPH_08609 [Tolypocladium ophioglossoides CBS 100239]|uniref:Uncharacterized protein n=1 Tax=Tolypocladium ophioglossoides (strain CBS 100239) TaxID=1163406 RepID=A0A0L0MXX4_TOLOC|nr:hypothetical protein TOPH_08609 [Tolypocladium ophioglossoides CBS 100239]
MEPEGRPVRYPTPSVSANGVYRIGDPALSEIDPTSPRQPPAYGDERAPPQYQEEVASNAKTKAKARKTILIRLLTSIFVTVLVSLIVAAVVGRIHDSQSKGREDNNNSQQAETESLERFTMMLAETTALPDTVETSSTSDTYTMTTTYKSSQPQPTTQSFTPFACDSMAYLTGATPITTIQSVPITSSNGSPRLSVDTTDGSYMLGVVVYSFRGSWFVPKRNWLAT